MGLALVALLLTGAPDAGAAGYEDAQTVVIATAKGSQLLIEVSVKAGFHLNDDYPINFKPDFEGPKVDKKAMTIVPCLGHPEGRCGVKIPVPVPPSLKGQLVSGTLAFAACDADVCLIKKVPLAVRVER